MFLQRIRMMSRFFQKSTKIPEEESYLNSLEFKRKVRVDKTEWTIAFVYASIYFLVFYKHKVAYLPFLMPDKPTPIH